MQLASAGGWPQTATLLIVAANVGVCYAAARPVTGIGIMMPGFVSPLTCVLLAWILLGGDDLAEFRAPAAFVGGVAGPLVGADLLHLKDITRVSVGMLSIGGAGTFEVCAGRKKFSRVHRYCDRVLEAHLGGDSQTPKSRGSIRRPLYKIEPSPLDPQKSVRDVKP